MFSSSGSGNAVSFSSILSRRLTQSSYSSSGAGAGSQTSKADEDAAKALASGSDLDMYIALDATVSLRKTQIEKTEKEIEKTEKKRSSLDEMKSELYDLMSHSKILRGSKIQTENLFDYVTLQPDVRTSEVAGVFINVSTKPGAKAGSYNIAVETVASKKTSIVGTELAVSSATETEKSSALNNWRSIRIPEVSGDDPKMLFKKIVFSKEQSKYVSVSYHPNTDPSQYRLITSTDSVKWEQSALPGGDPYLWHAPSYSPELNLWVAVGTGTSNTQRAIWSEDGDSWNFAVTPDNDITWSDVDWSPDLGMFVAVGTNRSMYSYDGKNWQLSSDQAAASWRSIKWADDKKIFVRISNTHASTSSDGKTWRIQSLPNSREWIGLCYAQKLGKFFATHNQAGTDSNQIMYSENGLEWHEIDNTYFRLGLQSIAWSEDLGALCAVGYWWNGSFNPSKIIYSTDGGNNWNYSAEPDDNAWTAITWSDKHKRFVGLASGADGYSNSNMNRILLSKLYEANSISLIREATLTSWSPMPSIPSINFSASCILPDEEVAIAIASNDSSNNQIVRITSDNLTENVALSDADLRNEWSDICYNSRQKKVIAVGKTGNHRIMYSNDAGKTWTKISTNSDALNAQWNKVIYVERLGIHVAIASVESTDGNTIAYSQDGETWTPIAGPGAVKKWGAIVESKYHNKILIFSEEDDAGSVVAESIDGMNWAYNVSNGVADAIWSSAAENSETGRIVVVARGVNSGTNRIMYSDDTHNWTSSDSEGNVDLSSIIHIPEFNIFTAFRVTDGSADKDSAIYYSSDLASWEVVRQDPEADGFNSAIWVPWQRRLYAMGRSGRIMQSVKAMYNQMNEDDPVSAGFSSKTTSIVSKSVEDGKFKEGVLYIHSGTKQQFLALNDYQKNKLKVKISEGDSLTRIAQKINAVKSDSFAEADIMEISPGDYVLRVKSTKTGKSNSFEFRDEFGNQTNLTVGLRSYTTSANDARILVNGAPINSPTNLVVNAIPYINIEVLNPNTPGHHQTFVLEPLYEYVHEGIMKLISSYNNFRTFYAIQNERDPLTYQYTERAILAGNSNISILDSQMERFMGSALNSKFLTNPGEPSNLRDLDVKFIEMPPRMDGDKKMPQVRHLEVDAVSLMNNIKEHFDNVKNLFQFSMISPESRRRPLSAEPTLDITSWSYFDSAADVEFRDIIYSRDKGFQFPVSAISSPTVTISNYGYGNGNYVISESSSSAGTTKADKAFNFVLSDFWVSDARYDTNTGVYDDTTSLAGYNGEWIKIQLPEQITLNKYVIYPSTNLQQSPSNFRIYGSNDDASWTLIDERYGIANWTANVPKYFSTKSDSKFSYFALVVNQVGWAGPGRTNACVAQLQFFGDLEDQESHEMSGKFLAVAEKNLSFSYDATSDWTSSVQLADDISTIFSAGTWVAGVVADELEPFTSMRFPVKAMSAASNDFLTEIYGNGTYEATSSSVDGANAAYNAFSRNNALIWKSADAQFVVSAVNANNEVISLDGGDSVQLAGSSYNGPYLKIELPVKMKLEMYRLKTANSTVRGDPRNWRIFGSNDDTTWTQIDNKSDIASPGANSYYDDFVPSSSGYYKYYAIVVNVVTANADGGNSVSSASINEFELYGTPSWLDGTEPTSSNKVQRHILVGEGGTQRVAYSDDLHKWYGNAIGLDANQWSGICSSKTQKKLMVVSKDGAQRVATSSSGVKWTMSTGLAQSWVGVAHSDSINTTVAVANDGKIMFSENFGSSWAYATVAEENSWESVIRVEELGLFVAVASDGDHRVAISKNGKTWDLHESSAQNEWKKLSWSKDAKTLVAIASTGTNRIMTSKDAINWTTRVTPIQRGLTAITYSPEHERFAIMSASNGSATNRVLANLNRFQSFSAPNNLSYVDVSYSEDHDQYISIASNNDDNRIMISSDGEYWTVKNAPVAGLTLTSIAIGKGKCVVVGDGGGNRVMTSSDLDVWDINPDAPSDKAWKKVIFAPNINGGTFVAFAAADGGDGKTIMTSTKPDEEWNLRTAPLNNDWISAAYSPKLKMAAAISDDDSGVGTIIVSSDLENWESRNLPAGRTPSDIKWSDKFNKFIISCSTGVGRIMVSEDLTNWTVINPDFGNVGNLSDSIAWNNLLIIDEIGVIMVLGTSTGGSTKNIMSTKNLTNWTMRDSVADREWSSGIWSPKQNKAVIVSSGTPGISQRILNSFEVEEGSQTKLDVLFHQENISASDVKISIFQNGEDGDSTKKVKIEYFDQSSSLWTNPEYADLTGSVGDQTIIGRDGTRIKGLQLKYSGGIDEIFEHVYIHQGIADKIYNISYEYTSGSDGRGVIGRMVDALPNIRRSRDEISYTSRQLSERTDQLIKKYQTSEEKSTQARIRAEFDRQYLESSYGKR